MDIHILAGKCSEICNEKIFEIIKNRDKSKNHIIIAPDRTLFSLEQRLFDATKETCFFDVNIMSMSRFSKKFLINTNKNILTKQSGVALTKKLLIENKDKLHTFKKATNFIGFASELFETICLLKSCNISCEDMYVTDSNDYANLKQKDIKLIYSEYEKFLKTEYTDSFNMLRLFADTLNKDNLKNTCFYFVEFDDFTSIYLQIISKIARFSDQTYITCTYGKDSNNSNIYTNKVYFDLIDIFKIEGLNFKIDKLTKTNDLLENLLAYTPKKAKEKDEKINIFEFDNISDEISFVVADIYSKVRNSGITFDNFACVLPSMLTYKDEFERELKKYQIPSYFDKSELIINHELIRLILDICNLFDNQFVSSDYVHIIKNSILGFDSQSVLKIDSKLKSLGLKGQGCLFIDEIDDEEISDFSNKLTTWTEFSKTNNSTEFYFDNIICDILDYLNPKCELYKEKLDALSQRVLVQVQNKLINIINDYKMVFGRDIQSFDEFLETFKSYLESTNISLPPITSNTLFVADFESSYLSTYDYIYILGCNEGKLPSFKVDNGLMTDDEIALLPNASKINPTIALINSRKLFKLFDTTQKAKKGLFLSFLDASSEGVMYPNMLIKSLQNIFDIDVVNKSNDLRFVDKSYYNLDLDSVIFNNQSREVVLDNILEMTKNYNVYFSNDNFRKIYNLLIHSINDDKIYSLIDNNSFKGCNVNIKNSNMFLNNSTSVSQIETYYSCPYKHFARYGLRLKNSQSSELKPQDIGTIIHAVLKSVVSKIVDSDIEDLDKFALDCLEKILLTDDYKRFASNKNNTYVIKSLKKELIRIVHGIQNEINSSNFLPNKKYLEYSFLSKLKYNNIRIKGVIDRVDICGDNFIIIDYKTGDSSFDDYTDVYSGKKLQLLVYAKAFAEEKHLSPSGVFYLPIKNNLTYDGGNYKFIGVMDRNDSIIYSLDKNLTTPSYKSTTINLSTSSSGEFYKNSAFLNRMCISKEDLDYLLNYAITQVNKAVDNILKGDITPYPLKTKSTCACDYCEYIGLCNYQKDKDRVVDNVATIEELKQKGDK